MLTWVSDWRRLGSTTAVCFLLFFALLAWRVSAGHDPALVAAATGTVAAQSSGDSADTGASPEATDATTEGSGADPVPTTQAS